MHGYRGMRRFAVVALVGVAGLGLPAATAAGAPSASGGIAGGTLTIGIPNEIGSMEPLKSNVNALTTGLERMMLVFGTLMKVNSKTGAIIPGLAESVTTQDAQTWTLRLRPDVQFSDGTLLDADAVIFNFDRARDPANAFPGIAAVSQIAKITKIDARTVQFRLSEANGSFDLVFTDIPGMMVSPKAVQADPRNWAQKPVGAGAYLQKEWVRDQQMTFVRNPNYFDGPRPYIDTIVVKIIPESQTLLNALLSGSVDVLNPVTQAQLPSVLSEGGKFRTLDPAKATGSIGLICNLDRAPCNDVRYREALSLAFDFKAATSIFLADLNYSSRNLTCMPFGTASPFCAKDVKAKYNPRRAKALIDAVKADGISTDLNYTWNPGSSAGAAHGEFVQQQLAKIGVKVEIRTVSSNEFVSLGNRRDYQGAVNYQTPSLDMVSRFYNDFHSVGGPKGGRDVANFNNASLDVALERGRNSTKLEDKVSAIQEAQRIIAKNFLVSYLYPQVRGVAFTKTLQLPSYVSSDAPYLRFEEARIRRG